MDFHTAKLIAFMIALWGLWRLVRRFLDRGGINMLQRRQTNVAHQPLRITDTQSAPSNPDTNKSREGKDAFKLYAVISVIAIFGLALAILMVTAMSWLVTQVVWQMRDGSMAVITGSLSIHNQAQMQDVVAICIWIIVGLITLRIFIR